MILETKTKKLEISDELRRKVEMICRFANIREYSLNEGCIIGYKGTNVGFAKPHILKIYNDDYLVFENHDYVYINGYIDRILLKDLQEYLKNHY